MQRRIRAYEEFMFQSPAGFVNSDAHENNFYVRPNGDVETMEIVLFDFGLSSLIIPPADVDWFVEKAHQIYLPWCNYQSSSTSSSSSPLYKLYKQQQQQYGNSLFSENSIVNTVSTVNTVTTPPVENAKKDDKTYTTPPEPTVENMERWQTEGILIYSWFSKYKHNFARRT